MLDDKRLKEAEKNVREYLNEELIAKEPFKSVVFDTFIKNHEESIALAEHIHSNNLSQLWTIVVNYYSMFYLANAVLYKRGYKIKGKLVHKVTADALIVFVRNKLKLTLLEEYEDAKE